MGPSAIVGDEKDGVKVAFVLVVVVVATTSSIYTLLVVTTITPLDLVMVTSTSTIDSWLGRVGGGRGIYTKEDCNSVAGLVGLLGLARVAGGDCVSRGRGKV